MSNAIPNLLLIGGAHVDRQARLLAPHLPQTSNPVTFNEDVGGGCFNAGRAAKRFGLHVALLSARGGDAAGALVEAAISAAGIVDHSSVHLNRATPSYTSILEPSGELVTAIADMDLYETAIARSFKRAPVQRAAELADALLVDANLSATGLKSVVTDLAFDKPVYAAAISASKVGRFSSLLPQIACLFMNRFEAAALTGLSAHSEMRNLAAALQNLGLRRAVISDGKNPAVFLDGEEAFTLAPPPANIVDVTGAGDGLAGTLVASLLLGKSFKQAAELGMAAASLTVSRQGASPAISAAEIEALTASHQRNLK